MKKYLEILQKCPLFSGISAEELLPVLGCIGATVKSYPKGAFLLSQGLPVREIGILLCGAVELTQTDYHGNKNLLATLQPSELFGESFACAGVVESPIDAVTVQGCEVMLLHMERIVHTCNNACAFHHRMVANLLRVIATKNVAFHQKLSVISKRTTREKLLAFLHAQEGTHGSNSFDIPMDRQGLADYLCVDRSGLSAELGKLRREGVLTFRKNHFILH